MKKIAICLLALCLVIGLAACGRKNPVEPRMAALYLPNENADGFIVKEAVTNGTAEDLVALLAAEGALPEGCALLGFANGAADMNEAYGRAINSTGTAGEYLRIGCLVNTLLIFFGLEEITLTVEGRIPETGHAVYDQPLRFFENQVSVVEQEP